VKHSSQQRIRRAAATLACALLFAAIPLRAQSPAEVIRQVKFEQRLNAPLPLEAEFRDETGATVRLGQYFGRKPVVVALVYYDCPMLCTFILNGVVKSLRAMPFEPGREFEIVVVSFDARETPQLAAEKKQVYLAEYRKPHTAPGWHFLTGDAASIRAVTEAAGFTYAYNEETKQFAHASGILVAKPDGRLFRYFYGIEYAPRDLRLALVEAATERIGTPVDQVLLFCFHYDPQTGRYGLLITRILRAAGTATALTLAAFVVAMLRRERRGGMLAMRTQ
jgi:protein SCO1/2